MKKILLSILLALALALLVIPGMGATAIQQYNQTYADTDNGGADVWDSLAAWNTIWATDNGNQLLLVNTSTTTTKNGINLTVHSGPFIQGALGDKLYTLAANRTYVLGPFELSRFKQANQTILFQSNATRGKAIAVGVP